MILNQTIYKSRKWLIINTKYGISTTTELATFQGKNDNFFSVCKNYICYQIAVVNNVDIDVKLTDVKCLNWKYIYKCN